MKKTWYESILDKELIEEMLEFSRNYDKFNKSTFKEDYKEKRPTIIYTPPKKNIEQQRLRPKFRRKKLGEIGLWCAGGVAKYRGESNYPYERDSYRIEIEIEGEDIRGKVPQSLIDKILKKEIIVETLNDFGDADIYYIHRRGREPKNLPKFSLRKFLYECIVHSQYVEFEEILDERI